MGPVGLEPTTYGLKVRSSTIELEARGGAGVCRENPGENAGYCPAGRSPSGTRVRGGAGDVSAPVGTWRDGPPGPDRSAATGRTDRTDGNALSQQVRFVLAAPVN